MVQGGQGRVVEKATDLSFIHVGQTPRAEIEEKLKKFDVGINSPSFFIARWSSSNRFFIAYGGGGRDWQNQNMLVEFDDAGKVKSYEVFPDHELVTRLGPVVASQPLLDLSRPVEIDTMLSLGIDGKIILKPGILAFQESVIQKKSYNFQLAVADITSVDSSTHAPDPSPVDPSHAECVIHLDNKTVIHIPYIFWRHHAVFTLTVRDLITVLKFMEQSKQTAPVIAPTSL